MDVHRLDRQLPQVATLAPRQCARDEAAELDQFERQPWILRRDCNAGMALVDFGVLSFRQKITKKRPQILSRGFIGCAGILARLVYGRYACHV
jgi:hypothetical protein